MSAPVRLPMLEHGIAGRRDDCRNLPGCLARWLNLQGRPAAPGRSRGKGRAPSDKPAQCPARCEWFEAIPRHAAVEMAARPRTNWRDEA